MIHRYKKFDIIKHPDYGIGIILSSISKQEDKKYKVFFLDKHDDLGNLDKKSINGHGGIVLEKYLINIYSMSIVFSLPEDYKWRHSNIINKLSKKDFELFSNLIKKSVKEVIEQENNIKVHIVMNKRKAMIKNTITHKLGE